MSDAATATPVVLETNAPLSRSILWRLQREWFDQTGTDAWRRGVVPHHVTSNPFIAGAYADVIAGYFRDLPATSRDPAAPIHIVELGGGSGRFTFQFLRRLKAMQSLRPSLPRVRYVFTDFAMKNIEALRAHPQLQSFVAEGLLDFARFDAENDTTLTLLGSGETLGPGSQRNALVVISNYVFDGLPMDLFYIDGGTLKEGLVTITRTEPGEGPAFDKVQLKFERRDVSLPFYGEPAQDGVLEAYAARLGQTAILYPTCSIRALARLAELSSGRLLLVTADKGSYREDALLNRGDPALTLHGSFSLSVNYDAIGRWFRGRGGRAEFSSQTGSPLVIGIGLLDPSAATFHETVLAYTRSIEDLSPNDFHTVKTSLQSHCETMSIEDVLALVRLSGYDSALFGNAVPALMKKAPNATPQQGADILDAMCRAWDGHFSIGESFDLAFELGRLCHALQFDEEGVEFFEASARLYGGNRATYFNVALCRQRQRRLEEALAAVTQSLALDSTWELAREMRIKLEASLTTKSRISRVPPLRDRAG